MRLLNLFKIATKAIVLNKTRTLLTMLGIIIGVASVIAMLAIGEGSKESIRTTISAMGSNMITIQPGADSRGPARGSGGDVQTLTLKDYEAIKEQATLLSYSTPVVNGGGQVINGSNNWPSTIFGVNPDYLKIKVVDLQSGSMFTDAEVNSASKVVLIGQTVVDNVFPNGDDPVGQMIRFNNIPFKVIGVLEVKGENTFGQDQDDVVIAPYTTVQKRILAIDHLNQIIASAISEDDAPAAVEQLSEILRIEHKLLLDSEEDDFSVRSMEELISTFSSTSEMLTLLLVAVASISLLIGGIGIMNIMYVSVKERTKEIGLRMAVGGKGSDILMQFLIEAILISITGGIFGVILGLGSTVFIEKFLNWPTSIALYSIVISFAVCAITGIFFGWYPAKKASALDPITALRYE